ncbi:MAG: hypothetical protein AB7O97_15770 [Planctomycetota bacterium]
MPPRAIAIRCLLLLGALAPSVLAPGCAAAEVRPAAPFGTAADSLLEPRSPEPAPDDPRHTEAVLRTELATAADPTGPALELVRMLDAEQRLGAALGVLEAAQRRRPDEPRLAVARAGVLRDLGRRGLAAAQLRRVWDDLGPVGLHPGLVYELVELDWLRGDFDGARQALEALRRDYAAHPFVADNEARLDDAWQRIARAEAPAQVKVRDLLGDLRGDPDPRVRHHALTLLVGMDGPVAERALQAALVDPDPDLRCIGVHRARVAAADLADFCAMALSDPAPQVRLAGAERATALPRHEATALLLPTLAAEADAATFAELNEILRRATGSGRMWTAAAVAEPATRAAIVAEWRTVWEK